MNKIITYLTETKASLKRYDFFSSQNNVDISEVIKNLEFIIRKNLGVDSPQMGKLQVIVEIPKNHKAPTQDDFNKNSKESGFLTALAGSFIGHMASSYNSKEEQVKKLIKLIDGIIDEIELNEKFG